MELLDDKSSAPFLIVGVGLLGGSLGLAIRRRLGGRVLGAGRDRASLERALDTGIIDEIADDIAVAARRAQLVIACTPVGAIVETVRRAAELLPPDSATLITDVGSSKRQIVESLEATLPDPGRFVGGHPFAGGHTSGHDGAREDLFEGQVVVLTTTPRTPERTFQRLRSFWEAVGGKVVEMTPEVHDAIAATVSHLPHVIASALAKSTPADNLPFVARSWRDGTRVATSDVRLWTDILLSNRDPMLAALSRFEGELRAWRDALRADDRAAIARLWEQGQGTRNAVGD